MCTCQWKRPVVVVRRGVEHQVVGDVADLRAQERTARRGWPGPRPRRRPVTVFSRCTSWVRGTHEHLVGRPAPVRAHHQHPVVVEHDPVLGADARPRPSCRAGRTRRSDGTRPPPRRSRPGTNGMPEQLPVRVVERRAGLATVVDDRLRVADRRAPGVVLDAVADGRHHEPGVLVVEVGPAVGVLGAEHEHLVHAAGRRLGEHRAEVLHAQGLVALEGREQVRARRARARCRPGRRSRGRAAWPPRCRGRTGTCGSGRPRRAACREIRSPGSRCPLDGDGDPAPRERVEPELTHTEPGGSTVRTLPRR